MVSSASYRRHALTAEAELDCPYIGDVRQGPGGENQMRLFRKVGMLSEILEGSLSLTSLHRR